MSAVVGMLVPAAALQQSPTASDSVVVDSPLPGGAAEVARFLLNAVPSWVQITGIVLAAVAASLALRWVLRHRAGAREWITSRSPELRWAVGAAGVIAVVGAATAGTVTWQYVQHSNAFCTGCHVMNPAFERFTRADNKHAELSCHACHKQGTLASMRQLYLWVAERPEKIGPHAKVPSEVCEGCHVVGDTATWQHIKATAGHRVHLESDSSALKDVQCVTCHGVEVHRFRPVKETCGQTDCHRSEDTELVLGKMADQTVRHCTSCHPFTADVPALATTDSARGTLVPGESQCLGCHLMRERFADFVQATDPHAGQCGDCHRPHTQRMPSEARATCDDAGCHADWRQIPFHVGPSHRARASECTTCHLPHKSRVDASDCAGCHAAVRQRGQGRPPVAFDTSAALRSFDTTTVTRRPHGPYVEETSIALEVQGVAIPPPARADSFPHSRHTSRACLECHETGAGHGKLTFERPRGCALCHHQSPSPATCGSCHRVARYGATTPETVTVTVPGRTPRPRTVGFLHDKHTARTCLECHTTPVTLAPTTETKSCTGCHTDHHAANRDCSSCHQLAEPKLEHRTPDIAHQRCDDCHTRTTVEQLVPTRSLCITCHAPEAREHFESRECATCHFLSAPAVHRTRLLSPRPR